MGVCSFAFAVDADVAVVVTIHHTFSLLKICILLLSLLLYIAVNSARTYLSYLKRKKQVLRKIPRTRVSVL